MAAGRGASSRLRLLTTCSKRKNNKRSDPHAHTILTGMSYLTRHACCVALRPCFRGGAAAAEPVPSVDMVKVNELFDEFSTDEDDTESLNMEGISNLCTVGGSGRGIRDGCGWVDGWARREQIKW